MKMLLIILVLSVVQLSVASARPGVKTLNCDEKPNAAGSEFGLVAEFNGAQMVGSVVVANGTTYVEKVLTAPIFPVRSTDMVLSKSFQDLPYLDYRLPREPNFCSYTFKTPIDLVEYQTQIDGLNNSFSALWVVSGPNCSLKYKEIDLECYFVN